MKYVALLRGINVSGQKKIAMADLRKLFGKLGFKDVETYIQSGNVIFSYEKKSGKKLEQQIEEALKETFTFDVAVIVKSTNALNQILERNPFNDEMIYFTLFKTEPGVIPHEKIVKVKKSEEELRFDHDVAYFKCPNGYGKTKLTNSYLEKISGSTATTRNLKTMRALAGIMQ